MMNWWILMYNVIFVDISAFWGQKLISGRTRSVSVSSEKKNAYTNVKLRYYGFHAFGASQILT